MTICRSFRVAPVMALAAAAFAMQPATSNAADPFYEGKTVRFIVGTGVGGGYDAYARMLAPHYARELGATVVVENVLGGGGMRALNKLAAEGGGNGLTLNIVNGAAAGLTQLLDMPGAKYNLTEFEFLGIAHSSRWQFLVSPNSPYNSIADVMKSGKKINWAASGKISGLSDGAAFTCHALGLKCSIVTGYKGSSASALAMTQGEMDALYVSETSAYNYVSAKNAKALATMNRKRSELFPDLPTIYEELPNLTEEQAWWIDFHATVESLGRILMMPPGTPKARVDTLRAVTHKLLTDPQVVAEAVKRKRFIKYIPADEAKAAVEKVLISVTPAQKAQIKKVVLNTY